MSNTPVPVSIAGDISYGPALHVQGAPPDVFDGCAPMDWAAGAPTHSFASSKPVVHKGQQIALEPHDLGLHLPHMGEHILAALSSSRVFPFSSSTVMANQKPLACASTWPFFPMILCGVPFKAPTGMNGTNSSHSVFVGMNWFDAIRGAILIGAELVKDTIGFIGVLSGDLSFALDTKAMVSSTGGKDFKGAMTDLVVDLAASAAISGASGWERPIEAKLTLGWPAANVSIDAKWKVTGPAGVLQLVTGQPVAEVFGEEAPKVVDVGAQLRTPASKHEARWEEDKGLDGSNSWMKL